MALRFRSAAPPLEQDWRLRQKRILEEIQRGAADIICLEEVDHYHDWFEPQLKELGYMGFFVAHPKSRCLRSAPSELLQDGCAIFLKRETFSVQRSVEIALPEGEDSAHAALMVIAEGVATGPVLVVAAQLQAGDELATAQAKKLLEQVSGYATPKGWPVIICGDLGTSDDVYSAILNHPMRLASAYGCSGYEPDFTAWTLTDDGEENQRLSDFIMYSVNAFRPIAHWPIPSEEEVPSERLPHLKYPSSHLALLVHFECMKKTNLPCD